MEQAGGTRVEFDSTLAALQTEDTTRNPTAAFGTIDGWQQRLRACNEPELLPIADDLGELKRLLSASPLDGKAIGAVLRRLGAATVAANQVGKHGISSVVQQLGERLQRMGEKLG